MWPGRDGEGVWEGSSLGYATSDHVPRMLSKLSVYSSPQIYVSLIFQNFE